jgi:hypothetical protein
MDLLLELVASSLRCLGTCSLNRKLTAGMSLIMIRALTLGSDTASTGSIREERIISP